MYQFWNSVTRPVFDALQVRDVVEIGCEDGKNTALLLPYLKEKNGTLHCIDTVVPKMLTEWTTTYGSTLDFRHGKSLDMLPQVPRYDAVLIDGDHNWYTVFHELQLIETYADRTGTFPVVLLHDVGWPYARRDMYYDPDTVPEDAKHPFARKGIPSINGGLMEDGMDITLSHALYEGGAHNGVLTAVEDFLKATHHQLTLWTIPGLSGLGMLYPTSLPAERPGFAQVLQSLKIPDLLHTHLETLEHERLQMQEHFFLQNVGRMRQVERVNHLLSTRSWRWTQPLRTCENIARTWSNRCIRTGALVFSFLGKTFMRIARRIVSILRGRMFAAENVYLKQAKSGNVVVIEPDWAAMRNISIVIPVYNTHDETVRCIESVLRHSRASHRIVIVDDASTDAHVTEYFSSLTKRYPERITVLRNERNAGFVQSVNRGMNHAGNDDVILLNNDTVVPPLWIERLQEAAYTLPHAGSITPLSNEASIYSVLNGTVEKLLERFGVGDIDRHIERHARVLFPEIPTAVGFCMFMKRDALDKVGLFDERFGIGYGEENDWCMRAKKAGYRHYLHDGCFVYHVGHVAMKEAGHTNGEGTIPMHEMLLQSMHPTYAQEVADFVATGTMDAVRSHIDGHIGQCSAMRKRIAYILHNPVRSGVIGGVEYHVADLEKALRDRYECFTISQVGNITAVQSECGDGVTQRLYQYYKKGESAHDVLNTMDWILRRFGFDLVHVHHLMHFTFELLPLVREHGIPVVYNVHDWLFVNDDAHPICTKNSEVIDLLTVKERTPFLQSVQAIITPSQTAMDIVGSVYAQLPAAKHVFTYGTDMKRRNVRPRNDGLTICFLSYTHADHKGKALAKELVPLLLRAGCRIVFLGSQARYWPEFSREPMVEFAGLYERDDVGEHLKRIAPHLVCILSITPETHCFAIGEAWHAGIPVYVTPLGAPAERIGTVGGGRIAPSFDATEMANDMLEFLTSSDYMQARQDIETIRFTSVADMANDHQLLYEELMAAASSRSTP